MTLLAAPLFEGIPLAGYAIDGVEGPHPGPLHPVTVVDTTALDDGVHFLQLTVVAADQTTTEVETPFCVANGAKAEPPFQGTFVDITGPSGLSALEQPAMGSGAGTEIAGAVAADFDGDGDVDLFAWNVGGGRLFEQVASLEFAPKGPVFEGVRAAGAGDLDGDGDADMVIAGERVAVLRNDGGELVDVTDGAGPPFDPAVDHAFLGVTFADVDADGLLDVALSQLDCNAGKPRFVLRNEGDLRFVDVAGALGLSDPEGGGYGMSLDRLGGDEVLHVFPFTEGCRPSSSAHRRFGPGADLPVMLDTEPSVFSLVPPMGSAWLDGDGDGALDLWLAGDVLSPFLQAPSFVTTLGPSVGVDSFVDEMGNPISAWSMAVLDADLDGRPDVYVVHHPSDPVFGAEESSRDALFWQREPGALRDVAPTAGLGGEHRCRGVFPVDIDRDGDTDLVTGCLEGIRLLRNDLVDPSPGRTVELHGTVSSSDGVHAILETGSGERRLVRGGGQPYSGGVVTETVRAPEGSILIEWPSGLRQSVGVGKGPVVTVTEPRVVRVSPRRTAAASPDLVDVEVSPKAFGEPGAKVEVTASAGTWSEPLGKEPDGVYRGKLLPPKAVTTIVFEVSVAGKPLAVRPRVFVR